MSSIESMIVRPYVPNAMNAMRGTRNPSITLLIYILNQIHVSNCYKYEQRTTKTISHLYAFICLSIFK